MDGGRGPGDGTQRCEQLHQHKHDQHIVSYLMQHELHQRDGRIQVPAAEMTEKNRKDPMNSPMAACAMACILIYSKYINSGSNLEGSKTPPYLRTTWECERWVVFAMALQNLRYSSGPPMSSGGLAFTPSMQHGTIDF